MRLIEKKYSAEWIQDMLQHRPYQYCFPADDKCSTEGFNTEFSPAHIAILCNNYELMWNFVDEYGFDINFYQAPYNQTTLLHTVGKYRKELFTDQEKQHVKLLIMNTQKLDNKTRLGSRSFIELANLFENPNY